MFGRKSHGDAQARLDAIGRSQAMIEFKLDGTIITANKNFLDALGYRLEEIQGKHHSMFVPADQRDNACDGAGEIPEDAATGVFVVHGTSVG